MINFINMKYPKGWNKLSLVEQESWLVKEYQRLCKLETEVTRVLASVRGGYKYEVKEIDRIDLIELKS